MPTSFGNWRARPSTRGGPAGVVGGIRAKTSSTVLAEGEREFLSDHVPAYMVPQKFVLLDSFPLTPNGKADRRQVGRRYACCMAVGQAR